MISRKVLLALGGGITAAWPVAARTSNDASDARYGQLVRTDAEWNAAGAARDIARIRRVLAPYYVQFNQDGTVMPLEEALRKIAAIPSRADDFAETEKKVALGECTGIVTSLYTEVGHTPKGFYRVVVRAAGVFRYARGQWKAIVGYGHVVDLKSGQPTPLRV